LIPIMSSRSFGGRLFNPASIAGLQLWLKTDTIALNDGDLVSSWTDQSGNANNASASGAQRPTYKTAGGFAINGRAIVSAGGTSGVLMNLASNISLSGAYTCYAVGRRNANQYLLPVSTASGSACLTVWNDNNCYVPDDSNNTPQVAYTGSAGIVLIRFQRSSSGSTPNFAATGMSQANFNTSNGTLTIGRILARGAGEVTSQGFGEILLWNADLTTAQRNQVEAYLGARWGVAALT
jgi:hypothetical protein